MQITKRTLVAVGLTLATLASPALAQKAATNQELKIGITQEFENFNPLIGTMVATTYMQSLAIRGLVYMTPDGKWAPGIAKYVPALENGTAKLVDKGNNTKGMIVTWEIQDQAQWGDGTPITCADILFTVEAGRNPNISVGSREPYENIESVKWEDKNPKKCTVTYKKAKYDFYAATPSPMPRHLEEAILKKYAGKKEGYDQNSLYSKQPTNPGLYNGPYIISEIKLGSHVTFVENPKWWGKKPNIKKMIFKLIPNTGTLEANLRSGTIDMVSVLGFSFDQALAFEKKVKSEKLPYDVLFKEGTTYEHVDLNLDNPILKDIKVRKALVFAMNRQELTKALFEGKQNPAIHNLSSIDPWYTDDPKKVVIYQSSRREAARLLDEAGWKLGPDGIRVKDGKKLELQFMTTAGNKTRETVQTLLQSQWKSVGIQVNIKNEPARVFFGETMKKRQYGGMAMYAWVSTPESSPRSTLRSDNIPSQANTWMGQNHPGWKNEQVDKLIDQLETEFNPAKRKEIAHQILKFYTDEVPVIPLYYRAEVAVAPKNLQNYRLAGHQYYETNEAETWNLK